MSTRRRCLYDCTVSVVTDVILKFAFSVLADAIVSVRRKKFLTTRSRDFTLSRCVFIFVMCAGVFLYLCDVHQPFSSFEPVVCDYHALRVPVFITFQSLQMRSRLVSLATCVEGTLLGRGRHCTSTFATCMQLTRTCQARRTCTDCSGESLKRSWQS